MASEQLLAVPSSTQVPKLARTKQPIIYKSSAQYADGVRAHADLWRPYSETGSINISVDAPKSHGDFVSLHDLAVPENDSNRVRHFDDIENFEAACDEASRQDNPSLILFLKGHPSPEWLNAIGWRCNVDPEFFLRHLDFRSSTPELNYFTLPSPPSSSDNIIRLRIPSVGCRQYSGFHNQSEVERLRSNSANQMKEYFSNTRRENGLKTGDSIVRSFSIHDEEHYSLEQDVSCCVNEFGKGWIGIIWLDTGNELGEGPAGPWTSQELRSHSWGTSIYPTILHRPNIALKASYIRSRSSQRDRTPGKLSQSASLLHLQYGRFLNPEVSTVEAFYALSDIFAFAISSESQFLNMVAHKIVSETERSMESEESDVVSVGAPHSSTISNMLYNKKILDEHIQRLKENILSIKAQGSTRWPRATQDRQRQKASAVADTLLKDFEYLLDRAKTLSKSCNRGMDIAGNNAMVEASRRAIMQQKRVSELTWLAFLFIPASFTTGFFGMNFKQLGQGDNPLWIWPVVLFPTYAVSLLLLYWRVAIVWLGKISKSDRDRVWRRF